MKCIHLLRKSCSESTVAANVLRWGTGALNIDNTRIGVWQTRLDPACNKGATGRARFNTLGPVNTTGYTNSETKNGRWPANLVLQHLDGCVQDGTRAVKPHNGSGRVGNGPNGFRTAYVGGERKGAGFTGSFVGEDGTETVTAWACAEGCPVAALDAQSGNVKGAVSNGKKAGTGYEGGFRGQEQTPDYGDTGGASRFFKQFTPTTTGMNTDLADYLRTLISPEERTLTTTEGGECVYLHVADPDPFPWGEHGDASVHGMTVEAQSVEGQASWLPEALRVLKPGAHLLLAAPDDEPIGDTGACAAEDLGFEVRDCILWVDQAGDWDSLHYVAKAARSERESGCAGLPMRAAEIDEDAEEGSAPTANVRNFHPTVKPVAVMARLLVDVPTDAGPVMDPFMGSGTTMMACVDSGHDGIGIERDPDYFPIADARVRFRDTERAAWNATTIVSDHAPTTEAPEVTLEDLLGL